MRITSTKKLKGVLEMPSLGLQISYDHINDKSQTATIDDRHYGNHEVQVALGMKLITTKYKGNAKNEKEEQDEYVPNEPMARLINNTPTTIQLTRPQIEIPPKGVANLPKTLLSDPCIKAAINNGTLKIDQEDMDTDQAISISKNNQESPLDIDNMPEDTIATIANPTTATIANPNNESVYKTSQSIKSTNAPKIKAKKDDPASTAQVYSPDELAVKEKKDKSDLNFVDKEQELERINSHPKLKAKSKDITSTKALQTEPLEGTIPIVMSRIAEKLAKKKPARTARKKIVKKDAIKENSSSKQDNVLDLE